MKKKMLAVLLAMALVFTCSIPTMAFASSAGEKWIDSVGNSSKPGNSRDVRNNTNGFDTNNYTPITYENKVTLYARNYGYGNDDNYDIKLYIKNSSNSYTQIGRLYGYGDNLKVEIFKNHSVTLVWQRHQIENKYYIVELTGPFSTTYKKDFKGSNTGYTSGNVYIKYNSGTSVSPTTKKQLTVTPTSKAYNGKRQGVTITPKSGVGKVTAVYYTGIKGTSYKKTKTKPKKIGSYRVSVDVAASKKYSKIKGLTVETFKIIPKKNSITKISTGKNRMTVRWSRPDRKTQGVTRYQLRYREAGKKEWITKSFSASKSSATVIKLKKNKKYQTQVRSGVRVSKTWHYSKWSSIKTSAKIK